MTGAHWIPFLLLCVTVEITPGPNMAYLAMLSIRSGMCAGFAAIVGIALGLSLIGTLAALGVSTFITDSRLYSGLLAGAGILYLLWLAWQTWHEETQSAPSADMQATASSRFTYFLRGLITNLLNPKAFLFYATLLPGFMGTHAGEITYALMLTGISVAIASTIHVGIVSLASRFAPYLSAPARQVHVRRVMALLLVGIAGWFAYANAALVL